LRNHREEIDGVKAHPHHLKRFIFWKRQVKSHCSFFYKLLNFFSSLPSFSLSPISIKVYKPLHKSNSGIVSLKKVEGDHHRVDEKGYP
jgi:hypothetical protein